MVKDNLNHLLKSLNLSTLSNFDASSVKSGFSLRSQLSEAAHLSTNQSKSKWEGQPHNIEEVPQYNEEEQSYQSFNINSLSNVVSESHAVNNNVTKFCSRPRYFRKIC